MLLKKKPQRSFGELQFSYFIFMGFSLEVKELPLGLVEKILLETMVTSLYINLYYTVYNIILTSFLIFI